MCNLRVLARICASTASTASTLVAARVEALFPQSRGTVEALFLSMVRRISLSKTAFFSLMSRGCRGSFPNSSQENAFEGERYFYDEYDYDDYEEWLEGEEDDLDYEYNSFPPWFSEGQESDSIWERAIDEIIDNEEPGQYPPGNQSGEDRFLF